ncbi:MAG: helix-hairpin-helix domain-containing protein [Akkermansiaceae bacterium]|jgi:endonuclease YncB( thermonuclease family)|nr:helix-hairpin-helix domain-containing protein [Akkermansiaceae bacterium]
MRIFLSLALWFSCLLSAAAAPKPLEKFEGCTFLAVRWADGDSFRVKTAAGDEHTIRLYGVDCLELHVEDNERNLDRLREQRRYFGISEAGKDDKESIRIALDLAKQAAKFTAEKLQQPFTLHTRFADGGGDPDFKRIYGYITLSDGKDLGALLVQQGLARAQGVVSTMPDGTSVVEVRGMLDDLEIQALKKDRGIWAKTNWETLPEERRLQRRENAEAKIAEELNGPGADFKIDPNKATKEELMDLDGIGEILAGRIIEERKKAPFLKAEDLLRVEQMPQGTIEKIKPHLRFPRP